MNRIIAIDTETFFSKKLKYSLRNLIAEQYCRSPIFDCYIVSASDGKQDWAGHPTKFNWHSLEGATIVSHNAYWDRSCYNELVRRGIVPQIKFAAWHCTANLTSYICNRRALAQAVEYLYKIKVSKEARDDSNNKHWPQDFSVDEQKRMLDYARGDARWCWRLWNDYSAQWPAHEQRLSNMTIEQGMRGVQIDTALLDQYLIQSHEMKIATEKLLPWLTDVWDDEAE